jgi:hypothetical protein
MAHEQNTAPPRDGHGDQDDGKDHEMSYLVEIAKKSTDPTRPERRSLYRSTVATKPTRRIGHTRTTNLATPVAMYLVRTRGDRLCDRECMAITALVGSV